MKGEPMKPLTLTLCLLFLTGCSVVYHGKTTVGLSDAEAKVYGTVGGAKLERETKTAIKVFHK
jgi:hypothetical protein